MSFFRVSNDNLKSEVKSLLDKILAIKAKLNQNINKEKKEKRNYENEEHLFKSITDFLEHSEQSIMGLKNIIEVDIEKLKENVAKYFCEDLTQFTLEQCFQIFVFFVQRFKIAAEENRKRTENMQKLKARQMNRLTNNNKDENDVISSSMIESTGHNNKIMFRSHDMNTLNCIENKFGSLKLRNSRPNSQECISNGNSSTEDSQHSSLIEFLNSTNDCNHNGNSIVGDGNVYGTNFRRIGSGRRSLRGFNNNGNFNNTENERERVIVNDPKSIVANNSITTAFNRFSPLRQTIKSKEQQSDSKESENTVRTSENSLPKINIEDSDGPNCVGHKNKNLANISTINKPRNFIFEFKRKPLLNQYIQQLTAIISPSKCVENNDVLYKEFHKLSLSKDEKVKIKNEYENGKISSEKLKTNDTVSMVSKERPSSMKLTKSKNGKPFSQRRSASISTIINRENSISTATINTQHSEINNNYYFNKKTSQSGIVVPIPDPINLNEKNKKKCRSILNEQSLNTAVKEDYITNPIQNVVNQQNDKKIFSQYKYINTFRPFHRNISQSVIQEPKG